MRVQKSLNVRLDAPPTPPSIVSALVHAAALAPSGDNCQPWRFHWDGRRLRVSFLAERAESFYDVQNTASWISLPSNTPHPLSTTPTVAIGHLRAIVRRGHYKSAGPIR